jgi:hypothetical protein
LPRRWRRLGVFELLRALCAGEDVVAGIVFLWARLVAKGSPVEMNSWLVTPIGFVDVTSQFRAAGLSIVVTPKRRMSACLPSGKGLALVAVIFVHVLKWWMSVVLVRLGALVRLEAVGHEVVALPHFDGLLGLRVLAAMRARC